MNYQLLIESYFFGTSLSEQEIELLSLELETQIMNINLSTEFGYFKSAPTHICEVLNLKKRYLLDYVPCSNIRFTQAPPIWENEKCGGFRFTS